MYTTYSAPQAVDRANAVTSWTTKMCLEFVWHCTAEPVRLGLVDADAAWVAAKQKEYVGTPPPGAPVYFRGFAHGHIALSLGGGLIRSTDWRGRPGSSDYGTHAGSVGTASINDLCREWYGTTANYLGWSRDYGGLIIRGLEETSTVGSGTPPLPAIEEDDMLSPEAQAWIEKRMTAHDAKIIAALRNVDTAEAMWTAHPIVKDPSAADPETAPRVTPSRLLERATWDTKVWRTDGPHAAIQELADAKTAAVMAASATAILTRLDSLKDALPGLPDDADVAALKAQLDELKALVAALPKG